MTRIKISFLFVLGIFLVIIAVSRAQDSNSDRLSHHNKRQYITWDGHQIVVINYNIKLEEGVAAKNLPPELCPIFFHPIPLNYADKELLITLPGVGPVTAELILRKRLEVGKIISSEQLKSIKGIGEKTAEIIEQYTTYDL